jgi:hypothetical protein
MLKAVIATALFIDSKMPKIFPADDDDKGRPPYAVA